MGDFLNLDLAGKISVTDPMGFRITMDDGGADKRRGRGSNEELLTKKAWEIAIAPIQSVGMNLFMLWMSGSSPGIFNVMILGYCLTSIAGQISRVNTAFTAFKTIDTTLQKLAYLALCSVSLAYLLYHASGMGLLPTSTGDWIAFIPNTQVFEAASGIVRI